MTAIQKVESYLKTHKRPVTIKKLADHYLVSQATVSNALNDLAKAGVAVRRKIKPSEWLHSDYHR
jgi:predicted transcriptional regulator